MPKTEKVEKVKELTAEFTSATGAFWPTTAASRRTPRSFAAASTTPTRGSWWPRIRRSMLVNSCRGRYAVTGCRLDRLSHAVPRLEERRPVVQELGQLRLEGPRPPVGLEAQDQREQVAAEEQPGDDEDHRGADHPEQQGTPDRDQDREPGESDRGHRPARPLQAEIQLGVQIEPPEHAHRQELDGARPGGVERRGSPVGVAPARCGRSVRRSRSRRGTVSTTRTPMKTSAPTSTATPIPPQVIACRGASGRTSRPTGTRCARPASAESADGARFRPAARGPRGLARRPLPSAAWRRTDPGAG